MTSGRCQQPQATLGIALDMRRLAVKLHLIWQPVLDATGQGQRRIDGGIDIQPQTQAATAHLQRKPRDIGAFRHTIRRTRQLVTQLIQALLVGQGSLRRCTVQRHPKHQQGKQDNAGAPSPRCSRSSRSTTRRLSYGQANAGNTGQEGTKQKQPHNHQGLVSQGREQPEIELLLLLHRPVPDQPILVPLPIGQTRPGLHLGVRIDHLIGALPRLRLIKLRLIQTRHHFFGNPRGKFARRSVFHQGFAFGNRLRFCYRRRSRRWLWRHIRRWQVIERIRRAVAHLRPVFQHGIKRATYLIGSKGEHHQHQHQQTQLFEPADPYL